MCMFELGGFVEYEEEIDGDFNEFNYCLAVEYLGAIYAEDFEALGEMDSCLFDTIAYWLNYDGEIGKDSIEEINRIKNGSIITCNNRTFIEAIIENKKYLLADSYIQRGVMDIGLYLTCILEAPDDEFSPNILVSYHYNNTLDKQKFIDFLNNLLCQLEIEFLKIQDLSRQKYFLDRVKRVLESTTYPEEYGKIRLNIKEYEFGKQLIKIREETMKS